MLHGTCCNMLVLREGYSFNGWQNLLAWFAENPESTGWEDWTTECCHRWCFCSAKVRGGLKWSSCELWWNWSCHMRLLQWCHGTQSAITLSSKNLVGTKCIWISCNIFLFLLNNKLSCFLFLATATVGI